MFKVGEKGRGERGKEKGREGKGVARERGEGQKR